MDAPCCRLLSIDLQIDPALGIEPDAPSIFGARQLLAMGRRLGWTIAHARRRSPAPASVDPEDQRLGAMRPLMTERVFFRSGRSISDSPGLISMLEGWRQETVFVASFDHVALLSALLACYEHGPRLILVEDVLALQSLSGKSDVDAFRTAAWHLAGGSTTIAGIIAEANRRLGIGALPLPEAVGDPALNMQV
jgi:hypothetical protein